MTFRFQVNTLMELAGHFFGQLDGTLAAELQSWCSMLLQALRGGTAG